MMKTIPCRVCPEQATILGVSPNGSATLVRCEHCTYSWVIPVEPDHEPMQQADVEAERSRLSPPKE